VAKGRGMIFMFWLGADGDPALAGSFAQRRRASGYSMALHAQLDAMQSYPDHPPGRWLR
jgi:hypothetical protein